MQKSSAAATGVVAILGLLAAYGPVSIDMYLPALPALAADLGATAEAAQATLSATFIGFALGQLLMGPLSDRFGRRPILLYGSALYVLSSIGCAVIGDIGTMTGLRFLQAIAASSGVVIARAVVRDLFDVREAARVQSLIMLVMSMAPLLAPFVGGYVLTWFGWRVIFWILALFGAVCLLTVLRGLPESLDREYRQAGPWTGVLVQYIRVLKDRQAVGLILTSSFSFAGMFAFFAGSPFVYIELYGVPAEHYGLLFAVNVLGLTFFSFLNSRLVMRLGIKRMTTAGCTIIVVSGLILVAVAASGVGGLAALVAAILGCIGCLALVGANALAGALVHFPSSAGTAAALFGGCQFTAGALAATFVGLLHDGTALPMALVMSACGLLSLFSLLCVARLD